MPSHPDPRDKRLVSIVRRARRAAPEAMNLLGVPYDGAVLGRRGAAEGPSGIRQAMRFFSNYDPELGQDLRGAKLFDLGDLEVGSADVLQVHAQVEREVGAALSPGSLLVVLGGDNSISLPAIRATAKRFGKVGIVVFDSHFDLRRPVGGRPTSGSSYGTALRSVAGTSPSRAVEIGIHGFLNSAPYAREARRMGLTVYPAEAVERLGASRVARDAYRIASEGSDAVYVSIDVDCLDLAYVSGVSAPSVGGLMPKALFEMLRFLTAKRDVVCADVVELAPPLDPTWRSQVTAATALVQMVAGFCERQPPS